MFNKKIKSIIGALAIAVFFIGCSASTKAGKNGWYVDYDEAKKAAQKKNKNLLIFFSVVDNDEESRTLKEKVFDTKEFVSALSKRFILVNLDFSASLSGDDEDQSEKGKKETKEQQRKINAAANNGRAAEIGCRNGELPKICPVSRWGSIRSRLLVGDG